MKLLDDTLKTKGIWSFKRLTALFLLFCAVFYAFLPLVEKQFEVKEFVFWGMLTYSGSMVGMTLLQKSFKMNDDNSQIEQTQQ